MSDAEFDRTAVAETLRDHLVAVEFFAQRFNIGVDDDSDLLVYPRRGGLPILVRFVSEYDVVVEAVVKRSFPTDLDPEVVTTDPRHHAATPHDTLLRVLNLLNYRSDGPRYSARFFDSDVAIVYASSFVMTVGLEPLFASALIGATIDRLFDRAMVELEPLEHLVVWESALNA